MTHGVEDPPGVEGGELPMVHLNTSFSSPYHLPPADN